MQSKKSQYVTMLVEKMQDRRRLRRRSCLRRMVEKTEHQSW